MEPRYNVFFAGQLLDGQPAASVRAKLAKLFNANPETLDRLFSGKAQLLKRDCDKSTALKYQEAMERAGAIAIVKASQGAGATPSAAEAPTAAKPMTAAQRIAALAAAPDEDRFRSDTSTPQDIGTPSDGPEEPDLAPVGAKLPRAKERQQPPAREVDTSGLEIGEPTERLSAVPPPPPPAPDTSHLDMANVGETIPNLPSAQAPPAPDTSAIELAPTGASFSEFSAPETEVPTLDISDMDLAPTGADVLEEKYRRQEQAGAPNTDHLSLES